MRLVLFEGPGADRGIRPGVLTDAGVVDASSATTSLVAHSPQQLMEQIIDGFDDLRPACERLVASAMPLPLDVVRLRPPLPRPGNILCCIGNYWEHDQREPRPLNMFLKNPDAVIGPGDIIVLTLIRGTHVLIAAANAAVGKGTITALLVSVSRRAVGERARVTQCASSQLSQGRRQHSESAPQGDIRKQRRAGGVLGSPKVQ